jgi:hypothetical protein
VSVSYLQDVLQDREKQARFPEATHARLLSEYFFKETNNRWYIARSIIERGVNYRNAAVFYRDPERAEESRKRLEQLL